MRFLMQASCIKHFWQRLNENHLHRRLKRDPDESEVYSWQTRYKRQSSRKTQNNGTQDENHYKPGVTRTEFWGSNRHRPHVTTSNCPRLAQTHTFRGDLGVVGTERGWEMVAGCSVSWLPGRQQAVWVGCRADSGPLHTGTHESIALHHFIKLFVYLFVLLLCARREGERLLGVRTLWIPVLFLVQSLRLFSTENEREKQREERGGRLEWQGKSEYSLRSVWRGCPALRSCGICPLAMDFGRSNRPRLAQGCCNR